MVTTMRRYCSGWLGQKKWRSTYSTAFVASGGKGHTPLSRCLRHAASIASLRVIVERERS
jgi:hypothetical protein